MTDISQHPDYALGFWEAAEGEPLYADAATEYRAGWEACHELKGWLEPRPYPARPSPSHRGREP